MVRLILLLLLRGVLAFACVYVASPLVYMRETFRPPLVYRATDTARDGEEGRRIFMRNVVDLGLLSAKKWDR